MSPTTATVILAVVTLIAASSGVFATTTNLKVDASADGATATPVPVGDPTKATVEQRQQCEACHLVMDSFYMQLMSVFMAQRKATRGVVQIKGDEMALKVCDELSKTKGLYGPTAQKMCEDFLSTHKADIMSTFSRNFEINDNVDNFYHLKHGLCTATWVGCMRVQDKPKINTCDACKLLMEDTERVFSWGLGRTNFGAKDHLYRVMEDLCLNLLVRHPVRYHHTLLEVCGEMTDDYSSAIVGAFQAQLKARSSVSPARKVCIDVTKYCAKDEL